MNVAELRKLLALYPGNLTVTIRDSEILEPLVVIGASLKVLSERDTRGVPDPDYPDDDYPGDDYPPHLILRDGQLVVMLERDLG